MARGMTPMEKRYHEALKPIAAALAAIQGGHWTIGPDDVGMAMLSGLDEAAARFVYDQVVRPRMEAEEAEEAEGMRARARGAA